MDVFIFFPDTMDYHTTLDYAFTTVELLDKSVQITYAKLGTVVRVGNEYFLNTNEPPIGRIQRICVMQQPDHL